MDLIAIQSLWPCESHSIEASWSQNVYSLKELCAKRIVSDISLCKGFLYLPKEILHFMLIKALKLNRVLAATEILKVYKYSSFRLPKPCCLRDWKKVFTKFHDKPGPHSTDYTQLSDRILSVVFLISIQSYHSKLEQISFNSYPLSPHSTRYIFSFIFNTERVNYHFKQFVLRFGATLERKEDLQSLINARKKEERSVLKLVILGLYIQHIYFPQDLLLQILDILHNHELRVFSLQFSSTDSSLESTFLKLQKFSSLKVLILKYMKIDFTRNPNLLQALSTTLHHLIHISFLNLHECRLSGCLKQLLQQFCKQCDNSVEKKKYENNAHCCVARRKNVKYLNLGACRLTNEDLLYLSETQMVSTLSCLHLDGNRFNLRSFSKLFDAVKENIMVLEINDCLPANCFLERRFPKFSSMKKLQRLAMAGCTYDVAQLLSLANELNEIDSLKAVCLSLPFTESIETEEDVKNRVQNVICKKSDVSVCWRSAAL